MSSRPDMTLPLDSKLGARLAGPALPFSASVGGAGVSCYLLDAREGATPVPIALGVFPWRLDGVLRLTVIAKASFALGGAPIEPDPLQVRDVHHRNQPLAHAVAASDRVPWKTSVDVTLDGHAHAPGRRPVPEVRVRFAVLHGGASLVDKGARVVGDRDDKDAAPRPFAKMPIVFERAYGGMGTPTNPIGCSGVGDDQPNVVDVENPFRPAGFGLVPAAWPLRNKMLGETLRAHLDAPVMELPKGFSFGYFQSAPADQQVASLPPDASIVLVGMHPERETIQASLPGARAVGAAYGLDEADADAPSPLHFRLDTLHVDADRLVATLVWRAYVHVRDEASLARIAVAAGVGAAGVEPVVPDRRPTAALPAPKGLDVTPVGAEAAATGTLDLVGPAPSLAMPFGDSSETLAIPETITVEAPVIGLPFAAPLPSIGEQIATSGGAPPGSARPVTMGGDPPYPPARPASAFFHDLSKRRGEDELIPRRKDEAPKAPPVEDLVDLDLYAALSARLDEKGARRAAVLEAARVDAGVFRKAERHWKGEIDRENKRAERRLRDRYDDAYVRAWEEQSEERAKIDAYARLVHADERGVLRVALADMGLDAPFAMRLRRVWRRRIAADPRLAAELAEALAALRGG